MGCARGHARSGAGATQAMWWGQGPGRDRVHSLWAQSASLPGAQPACLGHVRALHKAVQVSATCCDPGKLAASNELHVGGEQ